MLRIVRADEVPVEEYHISTGRLFKRNSRLLAALIKSNTLAMNVDVRIFVPQNALSLRSDLTTQWTHSVQWALC